MKRGLGITVFCTFFAIISAAGVWGTGYTWTSGGDHTTWTDVNNWGGSGSPGAGDDATFDGTATGTFTLTAIPVVTFLSITVNAAADVLTFSNAVSATTITITNATSVTFSGSLLATTLNTAGVAYNVALSGGGTITSTASFANSGMSPSMASHLPAESPPRGRVPIS